MNKLVSVPKDITEAVILKEKMDQAYELAALARQDRDFADEKRWLMEAKRLLDEYY